MPHPPRHHNAVKNLLPLKPADYLILFVLLEGERHGYRMVKEIEQRTNGLVKLEAGNLYRSIRRLIKHRVLEESDKRPAPESDDERRRYYRITDFGRNVVAAEAARMKELVAAAESRKLISDPEAPA